MTETTGKSMEARKKKVVKRIGNLFETCMKELTDKHMLQSSPIALCDVLPHVEDGRKLLAQLESAKADEALAQAALNVVAAAGRANTAGVVGILASKNAKGQVPIKILQARTGISASHIRSSRKSCENEVKGTFCSLNMKPNVTRTCVPIE